MDIILAGKVQGVGFRHFIRINAEKLNLKGIVRNKEDTVEIKVEGAAEAIQELIQACKRGPFLAKVTHIDVKEELYKGEWKSFSVEK